MARDLDFSIPSTDRGPRTARRLAAPARDVVGDVLFQDLELLLSELVANSVRYADAGEPASIDVRIRVEPGFARVEVLDGGKGFDPPARPRPLEDRSGGFGLVLLAELAKRWGAERTGGGMRVWFELASPHPRDRAGRWAKRGRGLGRGAESTVSVVL